MKGKIIARRYASAFFNAINDENLQTSFKDFEAFMAFYFGFEGFAAIMKYPAIKLDKKLALLERVFQGEFHSRVADFIKVLLRRNRIGLLPLIAEEIEELFRLNQNIIGVQVKTAVSLTDDERSALREKLSKSLGVVELREVVDPSLLGGMMLCFKNRVIDNTVAFRIKNLWGLVARVDDELSSHIRSDPGMAI